MSRLRGGDLKQTSAWSLRPSRQDRLRRRALPSPVFRFKCSAPRLDACLTSIDLLSSTHHRDDDRPVRQPAHNVQQDFRLRTG